VSPGESEAVAPVIGSPDSLTIRHRRRVCGLARAPVWLPGAGEVPHADQDRRRLHAPEIDGRVIATATERAGGWWEVTYWPRFFDRNQAITALTVTELLESGRDGNDPVVAALRAELL